MSNFPSEVVSPSLEIDALIEAGGRWRQQNGIPLRCIPERVVHRLGHFAAYLMLERSEPFSESVRRTSDQVDLLDIFQPCRSP